MLNENPNLDKYFPAGSAELNSVQQRVDSFIQSDTFTDNALMLTKKEFYVSMAKRDKDANKKYWIGLISGLTVGITGIVVTIVTAIILC